MLSRLWHGGGDIWYSGEEDTDFDYGDKIGSLLESPYEDFEKGDTVAVDLKEGSDRVFMCIGDGIFVRGRNVYSSDDFCPKHEVRKMRDENKDENYCPVCEQ